MDRGSWWTTVHRVTKIGTISSQSSTNNFNTRSYILANFFSYRTLQRIKGLNWAVQLSSVSLSCPTLCNPMNCSKPGLPVHHQLLEFTQIHVHWLSDAIQPSHPLSSPFPPAPNPSQHKSFPMSQLFAWGGQSTGVSALASFLPKESLGWSPSEWTGWISLQSKGLSRVFSNTTVQKPQFFSVQPSSQSNSHIHTWPQEKPKPWLDEPLLAMSCLCFWICYLGWS